MANYLFFDVMGARRAATRGLRAGRSLTVRTASLGQQCLQMAGAPNQASPVSDTFLPPPLMEMAYI